MQDWIRDQTKNLQHLLTELPKVLNIHHVMFEFPTVPPEKSLQIPLDGLYMVHNYQSTTFQ